MNNAEFHENKNQECIFDVVVDRIEGAYAACVQRATHKQKCLDSSEEESNFPLDIELTKIRFPVREGDVLKVKYTSAENVEVICKVIVGIKKAKKIMPRYIRF
ncbi:MAG: hypothetical protein J6C46_09775 [Clostridia bacterium]|nr:hypothetical protein [Clostridia bacterium]